MVRVVTVRYWTRALGKGARRSQCFPGATRGCIGRTPSVRVARPEEAPGDGKRSMAPWLGLRAEELMDLLGIGLRHGLVDPSDVGYACEGASQGAAEVWSVGGWAMHKTGREQCAGSVRVEPAHGA